MAKDKQYTSKDILVLSDRDHVRMRTNIYFGNMTPTMYALPMLTEDTFELSNIEFIPAVYKAIGEILDNAVDEFTHIGGSKKLLTIHAKPDIGWYSISDNGRGIPIDMHETGLPTPQVALGSLKAGRNFTSEQTIGILGTNGVGAACTNYCSTQFDVVIHKSGKKYSQQFLNGADKVSKPKIVTDDSTTTGTQVSFQLDPLVFKNVALPEQLIRNRAIEIAMTNPDVTVDYNGQKYRFKQGLLDLVTQIAADKQFYCFEINEPTVTGQIFIVLDAHTEIDQQMYTWVNSSLLLDGGKCNTQFMNALTDHVAKSLERAAKKSKTEINQNDVRAGILVLASLKIKSPQYDSQAKTRLSGPDLRKEMNNILDTHWNMFSKSAGRWLADVLSRAELRHHRKVDKDAVDKHEKTKRKNVAGLLDATSKDRSSCRVLLTEGLSAQSQICEARDPTTTAAFALTGKINNVYGATVSQILKMGKVADMLAAIGLTPGKKAMRGSLNFGQIVIATDADYDGDDIFTLLINIFYQCWPELFDPAYEPIVFRLIAPNVCLVKGKQRIHFTRRVDYEKVKDKYKGYEVNYFKGLGSMGMEDWEMILTGKTDTMIPIINDGNFDKTMKLLFSDDADVRKEWLTVT